MNISAKGWTWNQKTTFYRAVSKDGERIAGFVKSKNISGLGYKIKKLGLKPYGKIIHSHMSIGRPKKRE